MGCLEKWGNKRRRHPSSRGYLILPGRGHLGVNNKQLLKEKDATLAKGDERIKSKIFRVGPRGGRKPFKKRTSVHYRPPKRGECKHVC